MSANSERTEKPTGRHREQAREKGQHAHSQEVTSAVTLAAGLTTLSYVLGTGASFKGLMSSLMTTAVKGDLSHEVLVQMMRQAGVFFLMTAAPVLAAAGLASLACSAVQG